MVQLMDRLLQRWIESFDELGTIEDYKSQIISYRYAGASRYNLKNFENGGFSDKEGWTTGEESPDWREIYTYGFSEKGLPCYMSIRHNYNKIDWAGFYKFSDQLVESIEFCLATGIPSSLQRIEYQGGKRWSTSACVSTGEAHTLRNWVCLTRRRADN